MTTPRRLFLQLLTFAPVLNALRVLRRWFVPEPPADVVDSGEEYPPHNGKLISLSRADVIGSRPAQEADLVLLGFERREYLMTGVEWNLPLTTPGDGSIITSLQIQIAHGSWIFSLINGEPYGEHSSIVTLGCTPEHPTYAWLDDFVRVLKGNATMRHDMPGSEPIFGYCLLVRDWASLPDPEKWELTGYKALLFEWSSMDATYRPRNPCEHQLALELLRAGGPIQLIFAPKGDA